MRAARALVATLACLALVPGLVAQDWSHYGGDPGGMKYSPLATIDRDNVGRLGPAWSWETGEEPIRIGGLFGEKVRPGYFEATPLAIDDTLYLSTPFQRAVALDAETGRPLWTFDPGAYREGQPPKRSRFVHRGVAQWRDGSERRIFLNARSRLWALDAATGRPIPSFGSAGKVDLAAGLRWPADRRHIFSTSPPVVVDSLVIVGSSIDDYLIHDRDPPGGVQAFDARTGRRAWVFHTVPDPGEPGSETWEAGAASRTGHVNVWAPMTADVERGLLYLPVSAPSNDFYGGHRPGDNLFSQSIVCLDAGTGERVWHFQLIHHGVWDYDPAAPPALMTIEVGGREIDAVAVAGKTGFLYVFDRVTGAPVWPIEERPVPYSDVPGESLSATQPFPTRPPPFARQGFTLADVVDFTPAIRERALRRIEGYRLGPLFTPPSEQGTLVMPGWIGGAGWGGAAFDPETATLYVKATNRPGLVRLVRPPADDPTRAADYVVDADDFADGLEVRVSVPTRSGLAGLFGRRELPIAKPPYGTLTAIDLDRGVHRWQIPLGDAPNVRDHPALRGLELPPLGVAGAPGGVVTRGGLVFIAGGGRTLYAIDKDSGATLWEGRLDAKANANPMTYETSSGRQFVAIATGGLSKPARLVAFTLREQGGAGRPGGRGPTTADGTPKAGGSASRGTAESGPLGTLKRWVFRKLPVLRYRYLAYAFLLGVAAATGFMLGVRWWRTRGR